MAQRLALIGVVGNGFYSIIVDVCNKRRGPIEIGGSFVDGEPLV